MKRIVIASIIIILAVLMGCSPATPAPTQTPMPTSTPIPTPTEIPYCSEQKVTESLKLFSPEINKYQLTIKLLLENKSDANLNDLIDDLKAVKKEVELLEIPPCLNKFKEYLIKGFELNIQGFYDLFLNNTSSKAMDEGATWMNQATSELTLIMACSPNCKP